MESSMKLVYGITPKVLSPQSLIDCDTYDYGCIGGRPKQAIDYILIESEEDYPYTGSLGACKLNESKAALPYSKDVVLYMIPGYRLQYDLATKGPFVAMIDASSDSFKNYTSGVYYNPGCQNDLKKLNHGILVVGYGTDPKEGDYWLLVSPLR